MNVKASRFLKNLSYTFSSNLVSLLVSMLVILIVPKLIGIDEYGYWQLYLFYSAYIGFMHFGWNDGIYLRFGGADYKNLDRKIFFSQFIGLSFFQMVMGILIWGFASFFILDSGRGFILKMVAIAMILSNVRIMLLYILQATNRIKEYASITLIDRVLYVILIISILLFGIRDFEYMIVADLIGKFASLIIAMFLCRELVFNKVSNFSITIHETITNVRIGIKLMIANLTSILLIGVVRFGIERNWDISTFGKISLILSASNLMMIFINAISVIMFPSLRRMNEKELPKLYLIIRESLVAILLGLLLLYYPFKLILTVWLPQYTESFIYMALIFPLFVYEGKMAILINTYFKTLRKEKLMLQINIISLLVSILITAFTTIIMDNLTLAVLSIAIISIFRATLSEIVLSKTLNISLYKQIFSEVIVTGGFLITAWYLNVLTAIISYLLIYLLYFLINKQSIVYSIKKIRFMMNS